MSVSMIGAGQLRTAARRLWLVSAEWYCDLSRMQFSDPAAKLPFDAGIGNLNRSNVGDPNRELVSRLTAAPDHRLQMSVTARGIGPRGGPPVTEQPTIRSSESINRTPEAPNGPASPICRGEGLEEPRLTVASATKTRLLSLYSPQDSMCASVIAPPRFRDPE